MMITNRERNPEECSVRWHLDTGGAEGSKYITNSMSFGGILADLRNQHPPTARSGTPKTIESNSDHKVLDRRTCGGAGISVTTEAPSSS